MDGRARSHPNEAAGGYALLALIIAMMVMAIWMTVAIPDARIQAQRSDEIEFYYAGDQMAEGVARYYNGGKLSQLGLNFVGQRMPYGPLTELKKLRDGVPVGNKTFRFIRASAFIDPITNEEWEPIRIGDPRIRKFLLAWSRATGRPIPPTYTQLIGAPGVTEEEDEDLEGGGPRLPDGDGSNTNGPVDDEDDETWDEDDDEGDGDWEEDDEDDEGDEEDESRVRTGADGAFVRASFMTSQNTNGDPFGGNFNGNGNGNVRPGNPLTKPSFGRDRRLNPIIGVVSRSRARAVKTRFGLERHNQILFIYMPPPPRVQALNPSTQGGQGSPSFSDTNNNGINDADEQNVNTNTGAPKP
jgi:hypothetical protein